MTTQKPVNGSIGMWNLTENPSLDLLPFFLLLPLGLGLLHPMRQLPGFFLLLLLQNRDCAVLLRSDENLSSGKENKAQVRYRNLERGKDSPPMTVPTRNIMACTLPVLNFSFNVHGFLVLRFGCEAGWLLH